MVKALPEAVGSGDIFYMDYSVNDLRVRVTVSVDEWGDVSLWAREI